MGDYLTFRRMITPSLIQILFWLSETLNLFYWVRLMINTRYYGWSVVTGLLGLVVCAILIRVYLELLMVLFRIRSDVASIKRKMGEG